MRLLLSLAATGVLSIATIAPVAAPPAAAEVPPFARAVPGRLSVANANAGGKRVQTVTLPLTFASITKG